MANEKKIVVEFDESIVNHYKDLGMVTPFNKFVEMVIYDRVQMLLDRYMGEAAQEEVSKK